MITSSEKNHKVHQSVAINNTVSIYFGHIFSVYGDVVGRIILICIITVIYIVAGVVATCPKGSTQTN